MSSSNISWIHLPIPCIHSCIYLHNRSKKSHQFFANIVCGYDCLVEKGIKYPCITMPITRIDWGVINISSSIIDSHMWRPGICICPCYVMNCLLKCAKMCEIHKESQLVDLMCLANNNLGRMFGRVHTLGAKSKRELCAGYLSNYQLSSFPTLSYLMQ